MQEQQKTFDRTVCFTFFYDYLQVAEEIEKDLGEKACCDYLKAIINYGLFQTEPDYDKINKEIKYAILPILTIIDKSQEKRSRGFKKENTEQTEEILQYKREHPEASQREISRATGISLGKVNKALRSVHDNEHDREQGVHKGQGQREHQKNRDEEYTQHNVHDKNEQLEDATSSTDSLSCSLSCSSSGSSSSSSSSSCSSSYTSREREREHLNVHEQHSRKEEREDNADATENVPAELENATAWLDAPAELSDRKQNSTLHTLDIGTLRAILSDFENHVPYKQIKKKYNLSYDDINASMGDYIRELLSYHEELEQKEYIESTLNDNPSLVEELLQKMNLTPEEGEQKLARLITETSLSLDEWAFMMGLEEWLTYDGFMTDKEIQNNSGIPDYFDFIIETANLGSNTEKWKEAYRKATA